MRAERTKFIPSDLPITYWRDVTSYSAMNERLDAFFTPQELEVDLVLLNKAYYRVFNLFYEHYKDKPMFVSSIHESFERLPKNTSPGLPFQQGVKRGEVATQIKKLAKYNWRRVSNNRRILVSPCVAGARRTLRPIGTNKPRLVFAYPAYINVIETQFTDAFLKYPPPFLGWSYNWLDHGYSMDRLSSRVRSGGAWMNLDFSSFDASVPSILIRYAFCVIKNILQTSQVEEAMLDELMEYFIHTPLLMYSNIHTKHRGIPSGSAFTQLIGSIVNMLACTYVEESTDFVSLALNQCVWLGDDSCLVFTEALGRSDMLSKFCSKFSELGLKANSDKTLFSILSNKMEFTFLGKVRLLGTRSWKVDYDKLPSQVLLPEFEDKCIDDAGQRLIGLVWAYGYDEKAYRMLYTMYINMLKQGYTPSTTYLSKSMTRFMFVHKITREMLNYFPKFTELVDRYYGTESFSLQFVRCI